MNTKPRHQSIEPPMFSGLFAPREAVSHKGTYGHVAVFAGSGGHIGAGYLASLAALRAGCGLCTLCIPAAAFRRFDARYPEIMCDPIPDADLGFFGLEGLSRAIEICEGKQAAAIGPAFGQSPETREFVNRFLSDCDLPAVVDADALNVLDIGAIARRGSPSVLTPHPGEMAGLLGLRAELVQEDRAAAAVALAKQARSFVVLKGHGTVVVAPDGRLVVNPTGNPGMASAGMGDALTGIIASFIAQGADPWTASIAGVYLHGLAGDIAAREVGEASMIASDVIARLGLAIKTIAGHV